MPGERPATEGGIKLRNMATGSPKRTISRVSGSRGAPKPRFSVEDQPEVFFSTDATSDPIRRAVAAGRARKIGPRLYTNNIEAPPRDLIVRNAWPIVAGYFPGALVTDRTGLERRPASDGSIFVVHERQRAVDLDGIRIVPRRGAPPHDADLPFMSELRLASEARALLENMRPSRARRSIRRTLAPEELENYLADVGDRRGEQALNELRDQARDLAPRLGLGDELQRLDRLIGALQGTREARLTSRRAQARRAGLPYDERRADLFNVLADHLLDLAPIFREPPASQDATVFAFYEAYFSNFIEGTELPLQLAEEVVFHGVIPDQQPEDAHDIRGTYALVADQAGRRRIPRDADDLVDILREQHAVMLSARPRACPGQWKQEPNQAGGYVFVAPDLVEGTLHQGWRRYATLPPGFHRAVYAMFLVSEVHPFVDGNGRMARVLMNAELSAADQQRVIIPTIYRNNYLQALRALSRNTNPEPLAPVIEFAQRYSQAIRFATLEEARADLEATAAFMDAGEADQQGRRLRLPPS